MLAQAQNRVAGGTLDFAWWFVIVGALLTLVALTDSFLKNWPVSVPLLYLCAGIAIGPAGLGLLDVDPLGETGASVIERLAEIAVILSLFSAGLKMRPPPSDPAWALPVRLASISMVATVALIALVGHFLLDLPWGGAILLGAVLAPTDPVLASDVQVENVDDRDRVRFSLTGEAGLNDGTAFPFVVLGLGLLGLEELGAYGWRWVVFDLLWAVPGGLLIGALIGWTIARLVLWLRVNHRVATGMDDFLALGMLGLAYGLAYFSHTWAFLAAFSAGLAVRAVERRSHPGESGLDDPHGAESDGSYSGKLQGSATDPGTLASEHPTVMAGSLLSFSELYERVVALTMVLLVGALLVPTGLDATVAWFVPLVILLLRPLAVIAGSVGERSDPVQKGLVAWFGIRGIGSIYYLMYAVNHDLPDSVATLLLQLVLWTIAVSVVVHGVSVTPIMRSYRRWLRGRASS